jgi:hypothetical protein
MPDAVHIRIIFPDKTEHAYKLPTVKMLELSLEDIEARNLVLLASFYVLKYRQAVKRSIDSEKRRQLAAEVRDLLGKLEALLEGAKTQGIITAYNGTALFERLAQMYIDV